MANDKIRIWTMVGAALLLSSGVAFAQGPRQGGPQAPQRMGRGMAVGFHLPPLVRVLSRPDVGQEIRLTQEQRERLMELRGFGAGPGGPEGFGPGGPGGFGPGGPDGPGPGGPGGFGPGAGMRGGMDPEAMRAEAERADQELATILDAKQLARLREVRLQIVGMAAVLDRGVQGSLGVTSEQAARLAQIEKEMRPRGPGARPDGNERGGPGFGPGGPGGPDGAGSGPRFGPGGEGPRGPGGPGFGAGGPGGPEMRERLEAKIAEVLTSDQKQKFAKMQGAKFEGAMTPPSRPRGPRGRDR